MDENETKLALTS